MRHALIAALVLGLLATAIAVQNIQEIQSAVQSVRTTSIYDRLVDWLRPYIPGTDTFLLGDVIWFFFKYIILPLIGIIIVLLLIPKKYILLLILIAVAFVALTSLIPGG